MIAVRKVCKIVAEHSLELIAVAGALSLTLLRMSPSQNSYVLLAIKSLLHPTSLSADLLVRAVLDSPYTLAPAGLARLFAATSAATGAAPEALIAALQIPLWIIQAFLLFRLALVLTGSRDAAAVATLFYGMETSLVMGDSVYNTAYLERSLCMTPFLWGLLRLVQGRLWEALIGNALATYLHLTPALYVWPVLLLERFLEAWREPRKRAEAFAYGATAAVVLLPFVFLIKRNPVSVLDADYLSMSLVIHSTLISGRGLMFSEILFILEGCVLAGLAGYCLRLRPAMPLLMRAAMVCISLMVLGAIAFGQALGSSQGVWWLIVRTLPWVSLALFDLVGNVLLAGFLTAMWNQGAGLVLAFLCMLIIPPGAGHDWVLRLFNIALALCLLMKRKAEATAVVIAACCLSWVYWLWPAQVHALGSRLGLRGGLFRLPAFDPAVGVGLSACLLLGICLERLMRQLGRKPILKFLMVVAVSLGIYAAMVFRWGGIGKPNDSLRMAEWIRQNTASQSMILCSPVDLVTDDVFMVPSERSLFAGFGSVEGGLKFGSWSHPMAERLRSLGMDFSRVERLADLRGEIDRTDRNLGPERVLEVSKKYGVTHLLLRSDRPWPWKPAHLEGELTLYFVPKTAAGADIR